MNAPEQCQCPAQEPNTRFPCPVHERMMHAAQREECAHKPGYFEVYHKSGGTLHENQKVKITGPPGVGTELKKLYSALGFKQDEGCGCQSFESQLNQQGVEWCESRIGWIVERVMHQAEKKNVPNNIITRQLVKQTVKIAVKRAKKNAPKE